MRPNFFKIIENCIETGIEYGFNRACNMDEDEMNADAIKSAISEAIWMELTEYLHFDSDLLG